MQAFNEMNVIDSLLETRCLNSSLVLNGNVEIFNVSRRNSNFAVVCESGRSFFIKHKDELSSDDTILNESKAYLFLKNDAFKAIHSMIPKYYGYEKKNNILTVEYFPLSEDLRIYHLRVGDYSKQLAEKLGCILGTIHSSGNTISTKEVNSLKPVPVPWAFEMHRLKISAITDLSQAALELVSLIQEYEEIYSELESLINQWESTSFIHADIKLDNLVMCSDSDGGDQCGVKLVDWETSGIGDPLWDVASLFSSYLNHWVGTMIFLDGMSLEKSIDSAQFPLNKMSPFFCDLWDSYLKYSDTDLLTQQKKIVKIMRFIAAKLVQTAYEQAFTAPTLNSNIIYLLQLSSNIFQNPQEAAVDLLGIYVEKRNDEK